MTARFSIDRESFQRFLANAFVVQESGLDRRSLSAVIEVNRFIASDEFDMDRAMNVIADCTLNAFHASGVAIALLEADKLVYRAGMGSGSGDVGRQVPAVLIVSSQHETRREILRVENAASDTRIEAAICRQFGAMSLLMLPVYKKHALAGMLQVRFKDAHSFLDREVRTYRLMVGALEDAMLCSVRSAQKAQKEESSVGKVPDNWIDSSGYLQSVEKTAKAWATVAKTGERNVSEAQPASSGFSGSAVPLAKACRIYQATIIREVSDFSRELTHAIRTTGYRPWRANVRTYGAAISAAIVLSTAIWVLYPHHRPDAKKSELSASTEHGVQQQAPAPPLLLNQEPSHRSHDATGPSRGFKRVRIGPYEVDYIAEDVTIRQFETRAAKARIPRGVKEVKFGDDVIVRYFAATRLHLPQTPSRSETR
jgi:hypothetical protein